MLKECLQAVHLPEDKDSIIQSLTELKRTGFLQMIVGYEIATKPAANLGSSDESVVKMMNELAGINNFVHQVVSEIDSLTQDEDKKDE